MQPSLSSLLAVLKEKLTDKELKESVVYVIPEIGAGEELVINRKRIKTDSPAHLLFIDFEPGVNWSHACRYVLLDNDNKVKFEADGQYPPDTEKLKLLLKPENTEDWMLLTDKIFSGK